MTLDYKLNIVNEKQVFLPRPEVVDPIINSENRIFEITAANGYGKTFVLNLIAYALAGEKLGDNYILKSLRDSIKRYNNEDYYDLSYEVKLRLPDGKRLILQKESNKDKIFFFEGQPLLNSVNLHKKVSIVYDVPTAPNERLNAVIRDLGIWNEKLILKVQKYWNSLRELQDEFSNVRDAFKIKSYQNSNDKFIIDLELKQNEINSLTSVLIDLESLDMLNQLQTLSRRKMENETEKLKKEKKFKTLKKPVQVEKKDERKIKEYQEKISELNRDFKGIILKLIDYISDNQEIFDFVANDHTAYSYFKTIKETQFEDLLGEDDVVFSINTFKEKVSYLKDSALRYIQKEEGGKRYLVHNFLTDLLKQIDELIKFGADDVLEEITSNKSDFLKKEIENRISSFKVKDYKEIKDFLLSGPEGKVNQILIDSHHIAAKIEIENRKKGIDPDVSKYYELKGEIENIRSKLKSLNKEVDVLRVRCFDKIGLEDINQLDNDLKISEVISIKKNGIKDSFILSDLKQALTDKRRAINILEEEKRNIENSRRLNLSILEREMKKSVSKFTETEQGKVKAFANYFGIVYKNLLEFKKIINKIDSGSFSEFKAQEDLEFIKIAGSIIAHSMDNKILRPNGEYISFDYYEMVKKEFHCEGGIIIKQEDISTGLASANYLKQRIRNIEGDYVVILLDEIGNMEENTLQEVIGSIKKLEQQNRLVLALLTKPRAEGILINEY